MPRSLKAERAAEKHVHPTTQPSVIHDTRAAVDLVLDIAKRHKK